MVNVLAVFVGGGLGCVLRYLAGIIFKSSVFPFSTILVNLIGCFIFGLVLALSLKNSNFSPVLKTCICAGFCGGLTTFSSFSAEGFKMLQDNLILLFLFYYLATVILGLISFAIGYEVAKYV